MSADGSLFRALMCRTVTLKFLSTFVPLGKWFGNPEVPGALCLLPIAEDLTQNKEFKNARKKETALEKKLAAMPSPSPPSPPLRVVVDDDVRDGGYRAR